MQEQLNNQFSWIKIKNDKSLSIRNVDKKFCLINDVMYPYDMMCTEEHLEKCQLNPNFTYIGESETFFVNGNKMSLNQKLYFFKRHDSIELNW